MFCGTGNFSHMDEDPSAPSTPKGPKKKQSSSTTNSKNPYSTRGLDKFSTVLADLEARREKIMEKAGSQGVSMVRFVYSNSQDWVPIVVRVRDQQQENAKPGNMVKNPSPPKAIQRSSEPAKESAPVGSVETKEIAQGETSSRRKVKKSFSWGKKEGEGGEFWKWRPSYYWPMVMVLILICLVMFGRVFAICCTSIWWYLVPTMRGGSGNVRKSMKKRKEIYGRRLSDKRLGGNVVVVPSSQAKKNGALQELSSPRHHVNGKKG